MAVPELHVLPPPLLLLVVVVLFRLLVVVVLFRFAHPLTRDSPPDWPILLVPVYFYSYEIVAGVFWIQNTAMLLNTFLWTAVALFFFTLPYSKTLFRR